jgi:RNA polymerase sigma-70 factor (ECF subfamily)
MSEAHSGYDDRTHASLLLRLRNQPDDQAVWAEFVGRYGALIYGWCRGWRLQGSDAEDVTQDVLLRLATRMRQFAYDQTRSFRAWLKTLTRRAWSDFVGRRTVTGSGDTQALALLCSVEARDDLVRRLDAAFDQELLAEAMRRVRARVAPATWDSFRLVALEGASGADAAARLGLKVATVFVHKSNVQKMLQEEVGRLGADE